LVRRKKTVSNGLWIFSSGFFIHWFAAGNKKMFQTGVGNTDSDGIKFIKNSTLSQILIFIEKSN